MSWGERVLAFEEQAPSPSRVRLPGWRKGGLELAARRIRLRFEGPSGRCPLGLHEAQLRVSESAS